MNARHLYSMLVLGLVAGTGFAADTPADTAAARAAAADVQAAEPAVTAKSVARAGKGTPAARHAGGALDRLELETTQITGNRELPKVMVIVPWKRSDIGDLAGRPANSLVDEALRPVDRDVFRREVAYYGAVSAARARTENAVTGSKTDSGAEK